MKSMITCKLDKKWFVFSKIDNKSLWILQRLERTSNEGSGKKHKKNKENGVE